MRSLIVGAMVAASLSACEAPTDIYDTAGGPLTARAEAACVVATEKETGTTGVKVIGARYSEANIEVLLQVPQAQAPWSCLSSRDGIVQEVRYTGSEGWA